MRPLVPSEHIMSVAAVVHSSNRTQTQRIWHGARALTNPLWLDVSGQWDSHMSHRCLRVPQGHTSHLPFMRKETHKNNDATDQSGTENQHAVVLYSWSWERWDSVRDSQLGWKVLQGTHTHTPLGGVCTGAPAKMPISVFGVEYEEKHRVSLPIREEKMVNPSVTIHTDIGCFYGRGGCHGERLGVEWALKQTLRWKLPQSASHFGLETELLRVKSYKYIEYIFAYLQVCRIIVGI